MNTALWLRISSLVSLLFAAGHSLGGRKDWSPIGDSPVLAAMRNNTFQAYGVTRSYFDFYRGFGWSLSVFLIMQSVLLWQLGALSRSGGAAVRPLIATFIVATVACGLLSWRFIFPVPAMFSAALAACLVFAFLNAR